MATLAAQNERLLAENEALATRVAELERELGRHSGNSGRPPSSDTLTDKAKQAKQAGERLSRAERRGRCSCGRTTKASFPAPARAPACYGPGVRALAVYLMARQHLPVARAAELLSDALGAPVSTGWLAGLGLEAAQGLEGFLAELRRQLIAEDVLHADETGARISGARHWFHVACTGWLTLLDCHPRRGTAAFDDMAVLGVFEGTLVSDGWKPYWSYPALDHALCCAHLLRDLASVAEVASQAPWADPHPQHWLRLQPRTHRTKAKRLGA